MENFKQWSYKCTIYLVYLCFSHEQAYTMELEAEVAKLKEQNKELQDKQVMQDKSFLFLFFWTATTVDSLGLGLFW